MGLLAEFRDFAIKGNAIDLAVGIVIGAAFTKIVNSIVNDLLMPPIGMLLGNTDFSNLKVVLKEGVPAATSETGKEVVEVAIRYGQFINVVIEFLIIAIAVFMVVKVFNTVRANAERLVVKDNAQA
jgi:large conductance mechanosensitive channel